jgi:hypothetical protein
MLLYLDSRLHVGFLKRRSTGQTHRYMVVTRSGLGRGDLALWGIVMARRGVILV